MDNAEAQEILDKARGAAPIATRMAEMYAGFLKNHMRGNENYPAFEIPDADLLIFARCMANEGQEHCAEPFSDEQVSAMGAAVYMGMMAALKYAEELVQHS